MCWIVQYVDLGEIAHVLKAVASVHLNLSMIFVASHFLSAKLKLFPEWRLNLVFGTHEKCLFNRGNKHKDYVNIFSQPNFVSPEWRCPLDRGVPKERFHCK